MVSISFSFRGLSTQGPNDAQCFPHGERPIVPAAIPTVPSRHVRQILKATDIVGTVGTHLTHGLVPSSLGGGIAPQQSLQLPPDPQPIRPLPGQQQLVAVLLLPLDNQGLECEPGKLNGILFVGGLGLLTRIYHVQRGTEKAAHIRHPDVLALHKLSI